MIREGHFSSYDVITNKQIWLGVPLKIADKTIGSMVVQRLYQSEIILGKRYKIDRNLFLSKLQPPLIENVQRID